jgi:hypothetical protein
MHYPSINPGAGRKEIDRILAEYYGLSLWALYNSLGMIMFNYQDMPSRETRLRERRREECADFFKNIKSQILGFERLNANDPLFNEESFRNKYPELYVGIEKAIEHNSVEYRLEKLSRSDPERYKVEREWYEKYAKAGNLAPRKRKKGRYISFPYLVGAVWSNFIKDRTGRVHWKKIRDLMSFFHQDVVYFKEGECSLNMENIQLWDLTKQSKCVKNSHKDLVNQIIEKLGAFPNTGFPPKPPRLTRRSKG